MYSRWMFSWQFYIFTLNLLVLMRGMLLEFDNRLIIDL